MPKLKPNAVPSYRRHKQSGQAIVTLSGRDFLLGAYGSAASRAEYERLTAEWLANGRRLALRSGADLTVSTLLNRFRQHAETYYRDPDGGVPGELENFKHALRPLRKLYGATPAVEVRTPCPTGGPAGDDPRRLVPEARQPAGKPHPPGVQVGGVRGTDPRLGLRWSDAANTLILELGIPLWLPAMVFALPPALWLRRRRSRSAPAFPVHANVL
jgi:hypothetical protein